MLWYLIASLAVRRIRALVRILNYLWRHKLRNTSLLRQKVRNSRRELIRVDQGELDAKKDQHETQGHRRCTSHRVMPLEGGVYGKQDSLPITNFHSFRYRTKTAADLRLSPAESTLVAASVVDCSGCSERNEDAGDCFIGIWRIAR